MTAKTEPWGTAGQTNNPDFAIIPDDERPTRAKTELGLLAAAVIAGHTLFIPGLTLSQVHSRIGRVTLHSRGLRLVVRVGERNGERGCFAWAVPA